MKKEDIIKEFREKFPFINLNTNHNTKKPIDWVFISGQKDLPLKIEQFLLKAIEEAFKEGHLDRKFRKGKATAIIHFVDGENGSIRIEIEGLTYFFEGKPKIEEYKNAEGKNVVKKTYSYGGWEADMSSPYIKVL